MHYVLYTLVRANITYQNSTEDTHMKLPRTFFMPLFIVILASGCLFGSDDDEDVKKGSVSGKVTMIVTGEPVAGVKLLLVDMNAKVDSLTPAENMKAFVDSAVTGADGRYVIGNIPPGEYGVAPVSTADTTTSYTFTSARNTGTNPFTVNGDSHAVSFIAEEKSPASAYANYIIIHLYLAKDSRVQIREVKSGQWVRVLFIPIWYNWTVLSVNDYNTMYYVVDDGWEKVIHDDQYTIWEWYYYVYQVHYTLKSDGSEHVREFFIDLGDDAKKGVYSYKADIMSGSITKW